MVVSILRAAGVLLGVGNGGFTNPRALVVSSTPCREPLAIARTVALQDLLEFAPVDLAEPMVLRLLVPAQLRIGRREAEKLRLRHREIDELLPQLVVAEALDLPAHGLRRVLR